MLTRTPRFVTIRMDSSLTHSFAKWYLANCRAAALWKFRFHDLHRYHLAVDLFRHSSLYIVQKGYQTTIFFEFFFQVGGQIYVYVVDHRCVDHLAAIALRNDILILGTTCAPRIGFDIVKN